MSKPTTKTFRPLRTLKIGSFHLGSALSDILVTGVWNRILITDLGVNAAAVALLAALRYLIAPLTVWVGNRSDHRTLFGTRRLGYIYLGRLLMWLSLPLLPLVIVELAKDSGSVIGWGVALLIFLLYGVGTLVSGSPFLALVRDSAPPAKQGLVVVMVQTVLLAGFAIAPILYAILMPDYTLAGFWRLVIVAMVGGLLAWLVSVWGEEQPLRPDEAPPEPLPFRAMARRMAAQPNARAFFGVLAAGSIAMFAQDAILEPFGGDLFGLSVGDTTRFNAYYGTGVLLAMIVGSWATRRWLPAQYTTFTAGGLVGIAATLALLVVAALTRTQALVVPGLFAFGLASGIYTVGGVSLMIAMTENDHAGAYLGLWSVAQLVFRGVAIALGGVVVELGEWLTGNVAMGYAAIFAVEAAAALLAVALLMQVQRTGGYFQHSVPALQSEELAVALEA